MDKYEKAFNTKMYKKFGEQLYSNEICKSRLNGCTLMAPGPGFGFGKDIEEIKSESITNNVELFESLIDFFSDVESIIMSWEVFEIMTKEHDSEYNRAKDNSSQFKNNSWLKEHYYDKGYSWSFVKEQLSGYLNTATLSQVLNNDPRQTEMSYYVVAESILKDENPDLIRPIDILDGTVAFVRVKDNKLIDNIYLMNTEGHEIFDMGITFEKYLDLAYKAKLFKNWQWVYLLREKSPSYELMKRFFPVIFPHLEPDLSEFGIVY